MNKQPNSIWTTLKRTGQRAKIDGDGDWVIYSSRPLVPFIYSYGQWFVISVRRGLGNDNRADFQPFQHRAPEVIFDIA